MRICFIGGGLMAEAIIQGILRQNLAAPGDIVVSDVVPERRQTLSRQYEVQGAASNRDAIEGTDVVVLAVKPQNLAEVLADLQGELTDQLVLSIVAGARISTLAKGLEHGRVVRAMPNTPAQIGQGMSVWMATETVTEAQCQTAKNILGALGREISVTDEKYLDMATAVSGSGPGYVFLILESLIDAAVHIGMNWSMAQEMVLQTVVGSALYAQETGRHPAELRDMVMSPAGTTAAGLLKLEQGGVRSALIEAVIAAYERSQALGRIDQR